MTSFGPRSPYSDPDAEHTTLLAALDDSPERPFAEPSARQHLGWLDYLAPVLVLLAFLANFGAIFVAAGAQGA